MKRITLLIKKLQFFFWLWKTVEVHKGSKRTADKTYLARITDASNHDVVTYDAVTHEVHSMTAFEDILFERAFENFAKKGNSMNIAL